MKAWIPALGHMLAAACLLVAILRPDGRAALLAAAACAGALYAVRRPTVHSRRALALIGVGATLLPFLWTMLRAWPFFRELWNDPANVPGLLGLTLYRYGLPGAVAGFGVWWVVRTVESGRRETRTTRPG